jgi:CheY-like chemotaxis protein
VANSDALNLDSLARWNTINRECPSPANFAHTSRRHLHVLVVDDDYDTAEGLVRQGLRWGHELQLAYDGAAALGAAAAQYPDFVLLDIGMPFLDGLNVARQLRRDFRKQDCFIIGVTGFGDEQRRQLCIEAEIDLLLVKPVDSSLIETLLALEAKRVNRFADMQHPVRFRAEGTQASLRI